MRRAFRRLALQDRLVKKLQLEDIDTIVAANDFPAMLAFAQKQQAKTGLERGKRTPDRRDQRLVGKEASRQRNPAVR